MTTTEATSSSDEARTMQLFVTRGVVAIVWAIVFVAVARNLTPDVTVGAGVLLVLYPLIDVVASLIERAGPAPIRSYDIDGGQQFVA